jgi:hypothetical protein
MKLIFTTLFFTLALAVSPALAADLNALPIGQVLQQGDTSVVLFPQNYLPPGIPETYHLQQFGLMVTVISGRPNAATLQVKALIETEDGIRKWYRLAVPYQVPNSGSAWVSLFFPTGKQKVTAVYGLRVTVIDAGQEQTFF